MSAKPLRVADRITEVLVTEAALDKLGARNISAEAVEQLLRNDHITVRNPHGPEPGSRRLLIGRTDGARCLTLVIEQTVEPTTWLVITGWDSTDLERKLLGS
jgi:hypothetical protein